MVATRRQRSQQPPQDQEEIQPTINEYEKRRDSQVATIIQKMQEMGLMNLASEFNKSVQPSAPSKGTTSGNKKTSSTDSDSSDYILENDDQGDTDDDDTQFDDEALPLAIELPSGVRNNIGTPKNCRKTNMGPGTRTKRVRASEPQEVQPPAREIRSAKRLFTEEIAGHNADGNVDIPINSSSAAQEPNSSAGADSAAAESGNGDAGQDSAPLGDESGPAGLHSKSADGDNVHAGEPSEATAERAPRRPRCPTKGKQLEKMTKAMGRRLPIVVADGNRRPHEPVQAAKFASESGIIIRENMPILTHWKEYKKEKTKYYDKFVGELNGRLAINADHPPTRVACTDMMRTAIKNQRYRLKARYFNGVPANEIRTTSPVSYMTNTQWRALVAKWSDPKNMETCEKNKQNRSKVKYHQATGSRCYVAHLHDYKQKRIREEPSLDQTEELDAVEAFKTCHTSSKHGLSEPAREAVSEMEAMMEDLLAIGEPRSTSAHVVSSVLSQDSSHSSHQFLKNVGIKTPVSNKSAAPNEDELREQLAAEARAAVQGELEELKKKSEDADERLLKTQNELEEYKKMTEQNSKEMEENRILIRQLLRIYGPSSSGTPPST